MDDPFAPLQLDEISEAALGPAVSTGAVVVTPIPSYATDPEIAATMLFNRKPDRLDAYRDNNGQVLFCVCRWDNGSSGKVIRPLTWVRQPDGTEEWTFKSPPEPRPLFGLDALMARPDAAIVIVEGEKAREAAAKIFPDAVVVTWSGGSNAVKKSDWAPLAGRNVLIWPDADAPGAKAAATIVERLSQFEKIAIAMVDAEALAVQSAGDRRPLPIRAGWDAADAVTEWGDLNALGLCVHKHSRPVEISPHYWSFARFEMNRAGLYTTVAKGRGEHRVEEEIRISDPFEVIGRVRDPEGNGWAKLLRWKDEDGRSRTYAVADADLHGEPRVICSKLAAMGLRITRGCGGHLADYLNDVNIARRVTTVSRTGWHKIGGPWSFVLPDRTIGATGGETIILSGANAAPFEVSGSLDDWKDGVGRLVAGHKRLVFMVSAAFVGPLLKLAGQEGGGVHLVGPSSTGKTTCAEAAASVWGRGGSPGYVRSWRSTANALEATAALHTDTALLLDELGVAEAREAGAAIYQLSAGSGKGRAARDGLLRAGMTWRTFYISTGEIGLGDKLVESRQRATAGQSVRLLEIPADAGTGFGVFDHGGDTGNAKDLADAIKREAVTRYGTAGPTFLSRIIGEGIDEVTRTTLDMVAAFRASVITGGADGQVLRAADRFGLVAVAGELAIAFEIVPWAAGDARAAAEACFRDWLDARGGSEAQEVREAIVRVRGFIEAHGDSRFELLDSMDIKPVLNRAGYRRGHGEQKEWLVSPEVWKEILAGLNATAAARCLSDRGMLRRGPDAFSRSEKIEGRTQRFYVITSKILTETHYV
jgi:uncharacterized protein (DUF927 family)